MCIRLVILEIRLIFLSALVEQGLSITGKLSEPPGAVGLTESFGFEN